MSPSALPHDLMWSADRAIPRACLNGWWDFQPASTTPEAPSAVPSGGWEPGAVLAPSFFTKPHHVRRIGERLFGAEQKVPPASVPADVEYLFDAYGYPVEWTASRCGWHRRTLQIERPEGDERIHLVLDAVQPVGVVFFSGERLPSHAHPALPHRLDVTDLLRAGNNELAIFCADYPRGEDGRALVPTGNRWTVGGHGGVWQDAWLERRGLVHVAAVAIRTVGGKVTATWTLANAGADDLEVEVAADIAAWRKGWNPASEWSVREFDRQTVRVSAGGEAEVSAEIPDEGLARWSPRRPHLHWLRARLSSGGRELETHAERFGVREIRFEGKDLLLDGTPIHLFSDWGHKLTPYQHTEGWIRQWFGMIRDANMNHTRLHTHPHPPLVMELADELGILVTVATGVHGSGGEQGADDPRYWENARDHVRRLVERDRNHPSVILWSVENEMR